MADNVSNNWVSNNTFYDWQDRYSDNLAASGKSRRHFNWNEMAPTITSSNYPAYESLMGSASAPMSLSESPDFSTDGYTDAATERMGNALTGSLPGIGVGALGSMGLYSGISSSMGKFDPGMLSTVALSALNPAKIAPNIMSNAASSAMGLDPNSTTSQTVSGLGALISTALGVPHLGMLTSAISPTIAEGIGKLTGTRTDEGYKKSIESALGTGFLDTARVNADMASALAPSKKFDTFTRDDGTEVTLGRTPTEDARARYAKEFRTAVDANKLTSVWGAPVQSMQQTRAELNDAYTNAFTDPSIGESWKASVLADDPAAFDTYANAYDPAKSFYASLNPNVGYSMNPNSVGYEGRFNSAVGETPGLTASERGLAVRDYNTASQDHHLGDLGGYLTALAQQGALARAGLGGANGVTGGNTGLSMTSKGFASVDAVSRALAAQGIGTSDTGDTSNGGLGSANAGLGAALAGLGGGGVGGLGAASAGSTNGGSSD